MAKQSFISHVVNGYSRYDVPESKAFTCTPGILYPVRIDFINARDRVSIAQGIDVRSNPLAVPSFNPYTVRLHRFWVPLQLYHPEMRTNSSKFDMNDLSLNWVPSIPAYGDESGNISATTSSAFNSLFYWLRINQGVQQRPSTAPTWVYGISLPSGISVSSSRIATADTYLAYWDIVRNYYGYSQWGLYSIAWPGAWTVGMSPGNNPAFSPASKSAYFTQSYCNLEFLDAYYESQFYPSAVATTNNTYNRLNLFGQILTSDIRLSDAVGLDGYPVFSVSDLQESFTSAPVDQTSTSMASVTSSTFNLAGFATMYHPMAVVPSNPDRFSRMIPVGSSAGVSITGLTTVPQLAIASRLQEYKDLLGAGGNRYSDWLETFFASKIGHVDRPKLLFSASQSVNVQVVMNQSGVNNFQEGGNPLGQQGGSIAFNAQLGRSQSYYFREPGYLIDMLSIRPVYYWSGIRPDYLNYGGSDYFNPIYNDIGYQEVPDYRFQLHSTATQSLPSGVATEPCFNEFRASFDEVLGQIARRPGPNTPYTLYTYWVQQRAFADTTSTNSYTVYPFLFVDMSQVNNPFGSGVEDNFFVNLSYSVRKKNLVNKTFATRLSNR